MKKGKETNSKVLPIIVAIIVCICTVIGFGTKEYLQGSWMKTPVSNASGSSEILYRVLEIEPCWDYIYNSSTEQEKLATSLGCNKSNISFRCVSTAEFNGMNDDLVSSYDIIIMGLQTGTMNMKNGKTIYNDKELDGYIYLAYGDLIKYNDHLAGMLPQDYICIDEYVNSNKLKLTNVSHKKLKDNNTETIISETFELQDSKDAPTTDWRYLPYIYSMNVDKVWAPAMQNYFGGNYYVLQNISKKSWSNADAYYSDPVGNARFSGNDITNRKVKELLDYISTGRPIVLADELYSSAKNPNNTIVYPTSHVYEFISTIKDNENVVKFGDISSKLKGAIHTTTLKILSHSIQYQNASGTWVNAPGIVYQDNLIADSCIVHNVDVFRYSVDFKAVVGKSYFVKLIVDKDTDGRFDSVATVDDFNEVYYATILEADAEEKHVEFNINLPKNYNGMFGWQILVEELDDSKNPIDRVGVEGYTVVKGETKNVKVLQILPGDDYGAKNSDGAMNMAKHSTFKTQMNAAAGKIGYNIEVTAVTIEAYEAWFTAKEHQFQDYLKDYNMLVIGFADSFNREDISDDYGALSCITNYIESGKSVLFSHDTISFPISGNMGITGAVSDNKFVISVNDGWGERAGTMMVLGMRGLVGMDRYSALSINSYTDAEELEAANVPMKKDGTYLKEIHGLSDMVLLWFNNCTTYAVDKRPTGKYTLLFNKNITSSDIGYSKMITNKVSEINQGQITMYPYDVTTTGTLDIETTHGQWFQLDMEDEDLVVWYTLADDSVSGRGDYYKDTIGDAANNYYIYSKGNITYTGAGDQSKRDGNKTMSSVGEIRLFVNTVIRAATAGNFIPTVKSINGYSTRNAGTYVVSPKPYDTEYLIQFEAFDEDLATEAVIKDSYPKEEWNEHIGRFKAGAIYWIDGSGNPRLLKEYGREVGDDYLLNGKTTDFIIYNPIDKGKSEAEINADPLLKSMYDCYKYYNEKNRVDLRIDATDYYGETGSCIIQVIEQELFDLD